MSTIRAHGKHNLSFDPEPRSWHQWDMRIGKSIARARAAAGWSQRKLAESIGAAQTTVSSWERGRTEPTREDVVRIARALKLDRLELEVGEADDDRNSRTVPLVGYVGAGAVAHYYATGDGGLDRVKAPDNATDQTVAAEIRGVSLGPIFESWLVFWDEVRNPVTPDLLGELCVVGLPDDRVLVKKLRSSATPGRFHLLSNSEEPMMDQEVVWAARVKSLMPR